MTNATAPRDWPAMDDGEWHLLRDAGADESAAESRRQFERIRDSVKYWALRNGRSYQTRREAYGRKLWVRIPRVGEVPEVGRDGWTYRAIAARHRTPAERHPYGPDSEYGARLINACTAFRQARTGAEPDVWDVQKCDVRDHVRAVALLDVMGIRDE